MSRCRQQLGFFRNHLPAETVRGHSLLRGDLIGAHLKQNALIQISDHNRANKLDLINKDWLKVLLDEVQRSL